MSQSYESDGTGMIKALKSLLALCAGLPLIFTPAIAAELNPSLIVDVANGAVLHEEGASLPWYPASLTKLMTVYVTLTAVKERRLTFDTPLIVSQRAARMPPSKMGLKCSWSNQPMILLLPLQKACLALSKTLLLR